MLYLSQLTMIVMWKRRARGFNLSETVMTCGGGNCSLRPLDSSCALLNFSTSKWKSGRSGVLIAIEPGRGSRLPKFWYSTGKWKSGRSRVLIVIGSGRGSRLLP